MVVMADWLPLSTALVAPTSTSARPTDFRPEVDVLGRPTLVMCEQVTAVDLQRLGVCVGHLTYDEMTNVNQALRLVLDLAPGR